MKRETFPHQSFRINSRSAGFVTRHTLLGFQDVSQIKNKFQENGGKAVLAGIKNQIFLPGIDLETGAMLLPCLVLPPSYRAPKLTRREQSWTQNAFPRAAAISNRLPSCDDSLTIGKRSPSSTRSIRFSFRFPPRADLGDGTVPPRRLLDTRVPWRKQLWRWTKSNRQRRSATQARPIASWTVTKLLLIRRVLPAQTPRVARSV